MLLAQECSSSSMSILIGEVNLMDYLGFRSGDEASLKEIYDEYGALVFSLGKRLVGQDAEDLTQAVFISAWNARAKFDPEKGSMKTWLCGITRNKAIDTLRRRGARPKTDEFTNDDVLASSNVVDSVVDSVLIDEALDTLSKERKLVLDLCYRQGLTHDQISERTEIPLGTVKSHIKRGLEQLQQHLGSSYVD